MHGVDLIRTLAGGPTAALIFGYVVLAGSNDLHTPTGHIAVGWLVVEDLFTVVVLVLLPVLVGGASTASGLGLAFALTGLKVAARVAFIEHDLALRRRRLKSARWRRSAISCVQVKPAALHASTPPFSALTWVKPCARYFAA